MIIAALSLHRAMLRGVLGAVVMTMSMWACANGDPNACGGIVAPVRVLTPTPVALTLFAGQTGQLAASLSGGCAQDDTRVTWTSGAPAIASVDASGLVTAQAGGTATITATAFGGQARSTISVTVTPRIATTIDAQPAIDTLSPSGTRQLTVVIRDQLNEPLTSAAVAWRSLSPSLASVTTAGVVTALASGSASVEVATPRVGADSLRDTVNILVIPACSLVRPVTLGATFTGQIDASTCANLFGYRVVNQYSVTATAQVSYALRLTPTRETSLVPLNLSGSLFALPAADSSVSAIVVLRPGTFGFLVGAAAPTPGTYTVATTLNPDPRLLCVTTAATTGVSFQTAVTPSCTLRDIRILPPFTVGQQVRITATATGYPVTIELLNAAGLTVIQRVTAASAGATATINFSNTIARTGVLRVFGGANINELVTIVINQ